MVLIFFSDSWMILPNLMLSNLVHFFLFHFPKSSPNVDFSLVQDSYLKEMLLNGSYLGSECTKPWSCIKDRHSLLPPTPHTPHHHTPQKKKKKKIPVPSFCNGAVGVKLVCVKPVFVFDPMGQIPLLKFVHFFFGV